MYMYVKYKYVHMYIYCINRLGTRSFSHSVKESV